MIGFFGVGQIAEKEILAGVKPDIIFDNNPELNNTLFYNISVVSPSCIKKYALIKLIICSSSIADIQDQLMELSFDLSMVEISHYIGPASRTFNLEKFEFEGFISSGLPSTRKSLKGGGVYYVKESLVDGVTINKVFESNTHGMVIDGNDLIFTSQGDGIVIFDLISQHVRKIITIPPAQRPHGIRKINNTYFVALSVADKIIQVDENSNIINEYFLSEKINKIGTPQHHLNDIFVDDNFIYASMFSVSGNWKKGIFDGGVVQIDRESGEKSTIIQGLTMPHSVEIVDSTLHVLDSFTGTVLGYHKKIISQHNGFVRGFFVKNNYYIIGESKNRNISKLERGSLTSSIDSRITIIDPELNISRSIALPRTISEIHAVVAV